MLMAWVRHTACCGQLGVLLWMHCTQSNQPIVWKAEVNISGCKEENTYFWIYWKKTWMVEGMKMGGCAVNRYLSEVFTFITALYEYCLFQNNKHTFFCAWILFIYVTMLFKKVFSSGQETRETSVKSANSFVWMVLTLCGGTGSEHTCDVGDSSSNAQENREWSQTFPSIGMKFYPNYRKSMKPVYDPGCLSVNCSVVFSFKILLIRLSRLTWHIFLAGATETEPGKMLGLCFWKKPSTFF